MAVHLERVDLDRASGRWATARWAPGLVLIVLYAACAFLAVKGPSGYTEGIYQVRIGTSPGPVATVPPESLDCSQIDTVATCSTEVDGRLLEIVVTYQAGFRTPNGVLGTSTCEALFDDRSYPCESALGDQGHRAHSATLTGLGLSPEETAAADTGLPWRGANTVLSCLVLLGLLTAGAAAVAAAGPRDALPQDPRRPPVAATAVGATLLLPLVALLSSGGSAFLAVSPLPSALFLALPLGLWQFWLSGARSAASRVLSGLAAALAVFPAAAVALWATLLFAGYID